eukprot:Em0020g529a
MRSWSNIGRREAQLLTIVGLTLLPHATAIAEKAAEGQENSSSVAQSSEENIYTGRCGTVPVLDYLQLFIAEELDQILQSFEHTDWSLPSGWEKKIDPKTKKEVFIDHNAHFTMFLDPRLPYAGNGFQGCHSCSIRDTAYSDCAVAFLRQPNIFDTYDFGVCGNDPTLCIQGASSLS